MVGLTIAQYRIVAELGRGGMGVVYRAHDTKLQRDVALKFLPEDKTAQDRDSLLREARAASALNHPNICTIYEVGEAEGRVFIALEHIAGESLRRLIPRGGLPVDTLLRYATQIAAGLAHAHERGVIHRDLKAGNVMVAQDGRVKLLDFGLAQRAIEPCEQETQSIVASGSVSGTLAYLAPELLRGAPNADARSDLWALGVVLYEMAAGQLPFRGATGSATSGAILHEAPQALSPGVPASLRKIISRCLIKEPEQRYQSAREVLAALETVGMDTAEAEATHPPAPHARKATWIRRTGLALAGVLVTFAVLTALRPDFWRAMIQQGPRGTKIQSLAILPLKTMGAADGDELLGTGIADTLIIKVGQLEGLTVRPISAVRKYAGQEKDALTAARELGVDAVLDGTVQRSAGRLRINVNLLRARDGVSVWSQSFNQPVGDIFQMQDEIAQHMASGLRLKLTDAEKALLAKRYTSNPEAFEYFAKGLYNFDKRSLTSERKASLEAAISMFKKAIELDSNYVLARAYLAYSYAWVALFIDSDPRWLNLAREELRQAEALDPNLAQLHVVRHELLWSAYEGFQMEASARELRRAQQLDPSVGHDQLGVLYAHMGLEEAALRELRRALEIDPTSEMNTSRYVEGFDLLYRPDEALAANQQYGDLPGPRSYLRKVYLWKSDWEKARQLESQWGLQPDDPFALSARTLRLVIGGDFRTLDAAAPLVEQRGRKSRAFHHMTYNIACSYALAGDPRRAVEWLTKTVEFGMPNYTLFSRDPHLDPIRKAPAFVQFMNEFKPKWDTLNREFGGTQ